MFVSRPRRSQKQAMSPLVAFLLVASFGILFAGCKGPDDVQPDYTFTEEDLALRDRLAGDDTDSGTGATPYIEPLEGTGSAIGEDGPVLDLGLAKRYEAIRTGGDSDATGNIFRVTNDFVNLRSTPDSNGAFLGRVEGGELVDVLSFENAAWAKVKVVASGLEGFVSSRYIARLVSEDQLQAEQQKYSGKYFVNFGFVNIRQSQDSASEKLGEIPGQTIITPISVEGQWARVSFGGKEGFVSLGYLSPFKPNMLVRQDRYTLPVLVYDLRQQGSLEALTTHLTNLTQAGMKTMSLRDFADILLAQEERDVRVPPKTAALAVYGVTGQNQAAVSSMLLSAGASATLFIETKDLGLDGITEKTAATLLANGFDLGSSGHTGDDLRGLTNAQLDLELRQSKQLLEELTGIEIYAVGYPMGGVNTRVMDSAARAGYLLGITDSPSKTFTRQDLLRIPSYSVTPSMTGDEVVKLIQP